MSVVFHIPLGVCSSHCAWLVLEGAAVFIFRVSQGRWLWQVTARGAGGELFLHAVCAHGASWAAANLDLYVESCAGFDSLEMM